jgi:hypothetical protein
MTNDQGQHGQPSSLSSNLGWPIVVLGLGVVSAITVIVVTGHNVDDLVRGLGALFGATGTVAGIGAWIKSTQAAKQTNGALDDRMRDAVHTGIHTALQTAQQQSAVPVPVPGATAKRPKQRPASDGETARIKPPAA